MSNRLMKSAIVTGASSGIGEAYARLVASLGYDLIIIARRKDRLETIAAELEKEYDIAVSLMQRDLCNEKDISVVEEKIRSIENLSVLINNAGFGTLGLFADVDLGKSLRMINLHVTAPVRLVKAALPGMLARREGAIINVSSAAPFLPVSGNVMYNGTKSFLISFSESLEIEVKDAGIRVQALCPGFTRTGFHSVEEFKNVDFSTIPGFLWMSADKVVELSWKALGKRKVVFIPGVVTLLTCTIFNGLFRYLAGKRTAAKGTRQR
ncbi:MAG: SDR family oxidoreductase [Dehalococcoidia bacterium]|nr:SDR family oxidoreductase [Dehalococcoidia bacterium]